MSDLHLRVLKNQFAHPTSRLAWLVIPVLLLWGGLFVGFNFGQPVSTTFVAASFFLFVFWTVRMIEADPASLRAFGFTRRQAMNHNLLLTIPAIVVFGAVTCFGVRGQQWLWVAASAVLVLAVLQVVTWGSYGRRNNVARQTMFGPMRSGPLWWRLILGPGVQYVTLTALCTVGIIAGLRTFRGGEFSYLIGLVLLFAVVLPLLVFPQTGGSLAAWQAFNGRRATWIASAIGLVLVSTAAVGLALPIVGLWVGGETGGWLRLLPLLAAAAFMILMFSTLSERLALGLVGGFGGASGAFQTEQPGWAFVAIGAIICLLASAYPLARTLRGRTVATKPTLEPKKGFS